MLLEDKKFMRLVDKAFKSTPTDYVKETRKEYEKFIEIKTENGEWVYKPAPSDILIAETIPIKDIMLSIPNWYDSEYNNYRIHIFDNPLLFDDCKIHGLLLSEIGKVKIIIPLASDDQPIVGLGAHIILISEDGSTMEPDIRNFPEDVYEEIGNRYNLVIAIWYGIQVSLLHPKVEEVYIQKKQSAKLEKVKMYNKKGKKIYKYIKKIQINKDEVIDIITGGKKHKITKELWYVTGHFRTRNNKKTFIKGYWKGVLRNTKNKENEIRDRKVISTIDQS